MPWSNRSVSQMREEFVQQVITQQQTISELCRQFGISRQTGYKWITRYQQGEALDDHSRRPHTIQRVDDQTEQLIVNYRKDHPAIGALKIHKILSNKGLENLPCPKTINNILKRNGLISREASLAATPFQRFEKSRPNEMWQGDYKGHFPMSDSRRCHPLNIIDDHSRFNLCCEPMETETFREIKPVLVRVFKEYGLPKVFLCDNGNPWGTQQSTGYTAFEVWLMELGVLTIHGRALHPQTQGKEERFNASMKQELLNHTTILDKEDAYVKFNDYRRFYNEERPHQALNLDTPAQHYTRSEREYPEEIKRWTYPENYEIRKIKGTGYLTWKGQGYFLSEAFKGKEIAVHETSVDGCIKLFFRQFCVGTINTQKRVFTSKKIYLIDGDPRNEN